METEKPSVEIHIERRYGETANVPMFRGRDTETPAPVPQKSFFAENEMAILVFVGGIGLGTIAILLHAILGR